METKNFKGTVFPEDLRNFCEVLVTVDSFNGESKFYFRVGKNGRGIARRHIDSNGDFKADLVKGGYAQITENITSEIDLRVIIKEKMLEVFGPESRPDIKLCPAGRIQEN